jgi:hypothetical protein
VRRVLLALALVLVVGCTSSAPPDDAALARSAVLDVADLGRGWRSVPAAAGESIHRACGVAGAREETASVDSRRFLRGRDAVEGQVSLWTDARAAQAFLRRMSAPATTTCIRRHLIRSGRRFYDRVDVTAEPLAASPFGDAAVARRFHISSHADGFTATSYVDAVVVRTGRAVAAFTFVRAGAPIEARRDAVVRPVLARLGGRDALA